MPKTMQKYLFLFALCFFAQQILAQSAVIAIEQLNILYICLDNPISVAVAGVPTENITVAATGANIQLIPINNKGSYIAKVSKVEPVQITVSDKKTGKIYATLPFRVLELPLATVEFTQSRVDPRAAGFAAYIANFDIDVRCQIVSYTMSFTKKGYETQIIHGSGNRLVGHAMTCYNARALGDVIYFYDIMVLCPCDANPRRVPSINLPIQNLY
jgi:hypothetical protein